MKKVVALVLGACGVLWSIAEGRPITDCKAEWSDQTLTVGNSLFTRSYRCVDSDLVTTSFVHAGEEWIDGSRVRKASGMLEASSEVCRRSKVGVEGLKVLVRTGEKRRTLWIFPDVAGVLMEDPSVVEASKWEERARMYDNTYRKLDFFLKGADVLPLRPLHMRATEYCLQDMTDIRNELLEENSWLLMTREVPLIRSAPSVAVEDTFTGRGIACLRLAPLPHDRPDDVPDFSFGASRVWNQPNKVFLASIVNGYPVAELAYVGGEAGRIRALHALQRALRPYQAGRDGIFLSNTWGDGNRDARITAAFMMAEVKAGGELGVDVIQIDDGWQSGKSHNSALIKDRSQGVWGNFRKGNPDFWKLDPKKFPEGLGPIVAAAKARGMGFGLWFGPDKTDDYAGWELDADILSGFYREFDIRYFKIDGIGMGSTKGLANIRRFFDRLLEVSDGAMTFDLDVTGAVKRPSYFGLPDIGPLFVENRYAAGEGGGRGGNYWPHFTLRNIWSLSRVVDPLRLRVEVCNPLKGVSCYGDDPLAPKNWRGDTLFASVMTGSPLGWFEISELSPKTVAEMKPLVARWKQERAAVHGGETIPVGERPDGLVWTGFATRAPKGSAGYVLLFRELNVSESYELDYTSLFGETGFTKSEVIGGRGTAELTGGRVRVKVPAKLDFVWVKLSR